MNILIKETGELRSLSFIDWHDGQEYTEQLISASVKTATSSLIKTVKFL